MPEDYEGPEGPDNLDEPPAFFPTEGISGESDEAGAPSLTEVQVEGVYRAETNGQITQFVLVSDGTRKLPILIGPFEAQSIAHVIDNERPDRPMTHDLMKTLLDRLDGSLERVAIDDFWNTIYYAKMYIRRGKEELEIDARPSDAIALALRFDAPILVADSILNSALDD